jgi:hypothetical protein
VGRMRSLVYLLHIVTTGIQGTEILVLMEVKDETIAASFSYCLLICDHCFVNLLHLC